MMKSAVIYIIFDYVLIPPNNSTKLQVGTLSFLKISIFTKNIMRN